MIGEEILKSSISCTPSKLDTGYIQESTCTSSNNTEMISPKRRINRSTPKLTPFNPFLREIESVTRSNPMLEITEVKDGENTERRHILQNRMNLDVARFIGNNLPYIGKLTDSSLFPPPKMTFKARNRYNNRAPDNPEEPKLTGNNYKEDMKYMKNTNNKGLILNNQLFSLTSRMQKGRIGKDIDLNQLAIHTQITSKHSRNSTISNNQYHTPNTELARCIQKSTNMNYLKHEKQVINTPKIAQQKVISTEMETPKHIYNPQIHKLIPKIKTRIPLIKIPRAQILKTPRQQKLSRANSDVQNSPYYKQNQLFAQGEGIQFFQTYYNRTRKIPPLFMNNRENGLNVKKMQYLEPHRTMTRIHSNETFGKYKNNSTKVTKIYTYIYIYIYIYIYTRKYT